MLYIPKYNNGNCVVLGSNNTIRVYQQRPTSNSTVNYIDYYIDYGYIDNVGSTTFSSYSTIPVCRTDYTTNFIYRLDFDKVCIIFMTIVVLCYFLAFKPISRLFGRWLKL